MQLRLRELEPVVARRLKASAHQLQQAPGTRTTLEPIWSVFSLACSLAVVALYFFLVLRVGGAVAVFLMMLSPLLLLGALALPQRLVPARVSAPLVQALLTDPTLPRSERLYGEALLLLLETATPQRELLHELNRVVVQDRVLARQQERLHDALDPTALQTAEAEQAQLAQRLADSQDTVARESLAESLILCGERVQHLRALPLLLTRLEAHRELLCQALALAHTTLLRTRSVPLVSTPPELAELRASLRQLTSESRALEEASRSLDA